MAMTDREKIVDRKHDNEANIFACALLMPEDMFIKSILNLRRRNLSEEERITMLAKEYQVPEWAVIMRINHITLFSDKIL